MSDDENDYEQRRLDNIRKNAELLAELDLKNAVDNLGLPDTSKPKGKAKESKAKPVQPRKKPTPRIPKPDGPRRSSARLSHIHADPDETPTQKKRRLAELNAKRKRDDQEREELLEQERAAKRARHHDLDLATLAEDELTTEEVETLRGLFGGSSLAPRSSSKKLVAQRDDDSKKNNAEISALRKQLSPMVIRSRAKVTQDRIYSMAYHPEVTKDLIFFGDKHGQLGIWDALAPPEEDDNGEADDTAEGGRYFRLQPHWPKTSKSSISCVKLSPTDHRKVLTSAYDCTLRSTSFEEGKSVELFSLASSSTILTSFDYNPNGNELWVTDAQGGLTHVDLREGGRIARRQVNVKEKIGCVSVNQHHPHLLVSSSNDRMVKIWDTRKLDQIPVLKSEDDDDIARPTCEADYDVVHEYINSKPGRGSVLAQYEHKQSASSAYWDPSGRSILTTSYDDHLRIWNLDPWTKSPSPAVRPIFNPTHKISHSCQTGRWVTVFKAQWSPNPEVPAYFTVGNMNHTLNIFASNGEILAKLADPDKISAVQAVTASHPSVVARAASGNASGRCILWGPKTD